MRLMARLVKSQLRCAGHLVQVEEDGFPKRADVLKEQGERRRG